jgi:squalene-associated FAD-dependent desaturase
MGLRVAVVGAGWSGLAAAVHATVSGAQVSLFDMARDAGGRARSTPHEQADGWGQLDNGQHILIGAYRDTLDVMRQVGADPEQLLHRLPLTLAYPDGSGLRLPPGRAVPAFVRGVLGWSALPWPARWGLLRLAVAWRLAGFVCPSGMTVAQLCASAPPQVYAELIEPLCVAALNTPAHQASAQVLLNVLRDALFGPPGAADLLLPRAPLSELLPAPALRWLGAQGADVALGRRVQNLVRHAGHWQVDGQPFDRVILACSAAEAARLAAAIAPGWAARTGAIGYQPIMTVWLKAPGAHWPQPMLALRAGPDSPAQFGFDLGALGGPAQVYALVISGAEAWVARGAAQTAEAVQRQLQAACAGTSLWPTRGVDMVAVRSEKRATFACTPALDRPDPFIAPGLWAAGDYIAGPYPATLEGAVRSGRAAAQAALRPA